MTVIINHQSLLIHKMEYATVINVDPIEMNYSLLFSNLIQFSGRIGFFGIH